MITDLRNDLYDAILRRSTAFFQRHTSGMLISTLINDVERVRRHAMATVMSDFLQQLFTLLVMIGVVIWWAQNGVDSAAVCAGDYCLGKAHRPQSQAYH